MKNLLKNEVSQVSGGNDCYVVADCYYPINSEGNITQIGYTIGICLANSTATLLTPTQYSSSICPTLGAGATVNDPKVPRTHKLFYSNRFFNLDGQCVAVVRVGRDVC